MNKILYLFFLVILSDACAQDAGSAANTLPLEVQLAASYSAINEKGTTVNQDFKVLGIQ
ncbi:MAG: hypothetical protein KC454_07295 [Flavobacteriales bacterium]|nr:hypothetical protein [Flavobacteriales bacterium]